MPENTTITATIEKDQLVIRAPLRPPAPSKTGKSLVVASSTGFVPTTAVVNGKPVRISLNAIVAV